MGEISTLSPAGVLVDPEVGRTVGRFVIEAKLGEGGMGVVYAAHDPQLGRRVAVKILRRSTDRERFLREGQTMARLMHPNVAVIFDAGAAGDRLFVAMELVDGQGLDAWLKAGGHGWREILARFVHAGRGLAAAHAAGIVHRDFKPANVLIGKDGRVRVTDFGLALATGAAAAPSQSGADDDGGDLTVTGTVLGTPAYMAPEQRRGERVAAPADQYSFCVALHEGLYGARPAVAAAPRRSPVPAAVRRTIARGLSERPEDRWPSMDALLGALDAATPRRARWVVAGAGAVALAVVALVLRPAARPDPCAAVPARLTGIWDPERKAAIHLAFSATGLPYAEARWRTVEALTDRYAEGWVARARAVCLGRERGPEQAALRQTCLDQRLDSLRAWAGVFAAANVPTVRNAIAAATAHPDLAACEDVVPDARPTPSEPVLAAEVRNLRQQLEAVNTRTRLGDLRAARVDLERLQAAARAVGFKPLEAEVDGGLVSVAGDGGDLDQMDQLATAMAQIAEETRDDPMRAAAWAERVAVLARRHQPAEAHRAARYAESILAPMSGRRTEMTRVWLLSSEAEAFAEEGNYAQAVLLQNAAVLRSRPLYDPMDKRLVAQIAGLAYDLHGLGRLDEAEAVYARALELVRAANGDNHPMVPIIEAYIAVLRDSKGDFAGALEWSTRAQTHMEAVFGPGHIYPAENLINVADQLLHLGRAAEALEKVERARAVLEAKLAPDAPELATLWATLGWARLETGAAAAAIEPLEKALALRVAQKSSAADTAEVRANLDRARRAVAHR